MNRNEESKQSSHVLSTPSVNNKAEDSQEEIHTEKSGSLNQALESNNQNLVKSRRSIQTGSNISFNSSKAQRTALQAVLRATNIAK